MNIYQPYFIYNGIDSRKMGVIVTEMPPVVRAERRVNTIQVPGRSGSLHVYDGRAYESYTKTMTCAIKNRAGIDQIAAWLTGSGDMIFSSEPDKVYRVHMINQISITQMMLTFQKFQLNMDTYPFKYSVNNFGDAFSLTAPTTVHNKGTVYAEPIITIYGTGAITFTIGSNNYHLQNVDEYITVNSEIIETYTDNASANWQFIATDYPIFEVGENAVSWSGNVERIDIMPNWRWL